MSAVEYAPDDSWIESAPDIPGGAPASPMRGVDEFDAPQNWDKGGDDKPAKKSASTVLVELATDLYDFGATTEGEAFAVPKHGPKVVFLLRGGRQSLRAQLARGYFKIAGRAAPQQALADALLVIEGMAQESEPDDLHLRVARVDGAQWLDLGDQTGRAVKITGDGWEVVDEPPVLFKRTALMAPLPVPARGGDLASLWRWLNVAPSDRPLLAAALVAALHPTIPHPVLTFTGEQGSGKTSATKVCVQLLDPSPAPTRKAPRDAESWVTAAAGSWLVALDNVSDIAPWLSDSICRAVTGDGDVRRKLYTDGDLHVFAFRRCIVLNGIDFGALRGDLADRTLPIALHPIDETARLEENELWPRWSQEHPLLLGALLDLAAGVAGVLPSVRLDAKPRMADFARILAAVDTVLGTDGFRTYMAKQGAMASDSLTADEFLQAVAERIGSDTFSGSAAELLRLAEPDSDGWRAPKGWPSNARAVTTKLRRQAPVMRKAGWHVADDDGANKAGVVRWTLTPPRAREARNRGLPSPPAPPDGREAGQAGQECGPSTYDEPGVIDVDAYEADYPELFGEGAA